MKHEMSKILYRMFSTRLFCSLQAKERAAVRDALRVAVIERGPVSEAERAETRRGIFALPWAWEPSYSDVGGEMAQAVLARVEDPTVLARVAQSLGASLRQPELRERVFRAMVALLFADGGSDRDLMLLEPVRSGFRITVGRADEIIEDLKDELVSLVQG